MDGTAGTQWDTDWGRESVWKSADRARVCCEGRRYSPGIQFIHVCVAEVCVFLREGRGCNFVSPPPLIFFCVFVPSGRLLVTIQEDPALLPNHVSSVHRCAHCGMHQRAVLKAVLANGRARMSESAPLHPRVQTPNTCLQHLQSPVLSRPWSTFQDRHMTATYIMSYYGNRETAAPPWSISSCPVGLRLATFLLSPTGWLGVKHQLTYLPFSSESDWTKVSASIWCSWSNNCNKPKLYFKCNKKYYVFYFISSVWVCHKWQNN